MLKFSFQKLLRSRALITLYVFTNLASIPEDCPSSFTIMIVEISFSEIVEKYGLEDFYSRDGGLSNELPLDEEKKVYFSDKKLQSMWQRAEKAGFTGVAVVSTKALFILMLVLNQNDPKLEGSTILHALQLTHCVCVSVYMCVCVVCACAYV